MGPRPPQAPHGLTLTNCRSVSARTLKSATYGATALSWLLLPPTGDEMESERSWQLSEAERLRPLTWDGERVSVGWGQAQNHFGPFAAPCPAGSKGDDGDSMCSARQG